MRDTLASTAGHPERTSLKKPTLNRWSASARAFDRLNRRLDADPQLQASRKRDVALRSILQSPVGVIPSGAIGWGPAPLRVLPFGVTEVPPSRRTARPGTALQGLTCPSATECWAVGATSIGTSSYVITTTDGGRDWSIGSAPGQGLVSVSCVTTELCWAVAETQKVGWS